MTQPAPRADRLRVVMFVLNDCKTDARVLREAGTLADAGHTVTIMARPTDLNDQRLERERRDGFAIVRVPVPLRWRRLLWILAQTTAPRRAFEALRAHAVKRPPRSVLEAAAIAVAGIGLAILLLPVLLVILLARLIPAAAGMRSGIDWVIRWRISTEEWDRAAATAAPPADVFHAHDLNALHAAVLARARAGGALVYDSHEIFLESGSHAKRPEWARRIFRRREASWVAQADALVTVNEALATVLGRAYAPRRTVVLHNTPARWDPTPEDLAADPLRAAAGIPADRPVILYHGSLARHRGLEELLDAIRQPSLDGADLVFLGYGSMAAELRAKAADPATGGRVHMLEAVPPSELLRWVRPADVAVMPIQDSTLNHRLSTPNKLFEALAAGVPVVVSDLPEMRRIAIDGPEGPLGTLCDPTDPVSIARAAAQILALGPAERDALRARCSAAARDRWNWERESQGLLALYEDLAVVRAGAANPA
jgi:glycosyltransferase involved in cell wall biosynthesis